MKTCEKNVKVIRLWQNLEHTPQIWDFEILSVSDLGTKVGSTTPETEIGTLRFCQFGTQEQRLGQQFPTLATPPPPPPAAPNQIPLYGTLRFRRIWLQERLVVPKSHLEPQFGGSAFFMGCHCEDCGNSSWFYFKLQYLHENKSNWLPATKNSKFKNLIGFHKFPN